MKIRIFVTKEIYRKAMYCGTTFEFISTSCAIAHAVREIAPGAQVSVHIRWCFGSGLTSMLPLCIVKEIIRFDKATPEERLLLPEFSFEVDFPDELVNDIGIDEVKTILEKSETLEAV